MSRLREGLTLLEMVEAMVDGNPGAVTVMADIFQAEKFGAVSIFQKLDGAGIYGSDIWLAYKDVCGQRLDTLILTILTDIDGLKGKVRKVKAP